MFDVKDVSRRAFLGGVAAVAADAAIGRANDATTVNRPGLAPSTEICGSTGSIIDLHTHIFNALDLPIEGIFAHWAGDIGRGAAAMINAIALAKESSPGPPIDEMERVLVIDSLEGWSDTLAATTPPEVARDPRVLRAVGAVGEVDPARLTPASDREVRQAAFASVFRRFLMFLPPSIFAEEDASDEAISRSTISAGGRWVWLMTEPEWKIASYLCRHTHDIGLFVHHLMDMEHYYPEGGPVRPVEFQPARMREVLRYSGGRFVPFVAFDPKRTDGHWKEALQNGCVGVKVYPPNGYHADVDSKPWKDLFTFCESNDIPILAHCTPSGFQAHAGSGCNASPRFWVPVLKAAGWPRLRLCLGHAGGGDLWFTDALPKDCGGENFTREALELMQESESVYLEVAYFSRMFKANLDNVRERLFKSAATYPKLPTRLCYGTDWHMPSMFIHRPAEYLDRFQKLFEPIDWRHAFFHDNAASFLNIRGYIDRSGWSGEIAAYLMRFTTARA